MRIDGVYFFRRYPGIFQAILHNPYHAYPIGMWGCHMVGITGKASTGQLRRKSWPLWL